MPKYLIERELPRARSLTHEKVPYISQKAGEVRTGLAPRAQWLHSYVVDDHIFCVYLADDPEAVREHGRCGGFPVTSIHRVRRVIDPTTAEVA
jgi:hypothetical protein